MCGWSAGRVESRPGISLLDCAKVPPNKKGPQSEVRCIASDQSTQCMDVNCTWYSLIRPLLPFQVYHVAADWSTLI